MTVPMPFQVQEYIDLMAAKYHSDDEQIYRVWEKDRWEEIVHELPNASSLQLLIEFAACDIWGGCMVSFDGDCFDPPAWYCVLSGPPFCKSEGRGGTPEQAIGAALKTKASGGKRSGGEPVFFEDDIKAVGGRLATEEELRKADWGISDGP